MAPILQRYGCYFLDGSNTCSLPTVQVEAHTTIFSTASRTKLTQTFSNPSPNDAIRDCIYSFPLYDGVSVVAFTCRVGSRLLCGVVKERGQARAVYDKAVPRGKAAGLFEQLKEASDVFSTRLGNVPSGESVIVEITYVGELKHDAEADGIRFTLPTKIAPRYWSRPDLVTSQGSTCTKQKGAFNITVDVSVAEGSSIQGIQCPSHPIAVTMSNISTHTDATPVLHRASATLSLKSTGLDKDFVLIVLAKSSNLPKGLLENHPTIQNQRALMVTLIPKFSLPPSRPEIIFLVDRSGSMSSKIPTLVSAMKVFLKSLPLGVKFNICSFGTFHSFLWQKSKLYSQDTLLESTSYVESFDASLGGTEIFTAIKASIESRYVDIPCEIMLLTDGEVWDQQEIFTYLNEAVNNSESGIRVFTLGVGNSVSHAFIEGIARAGNGFSQAVGEDEKLDSKVVRMLKGGLSPHVTDYSLEVKYEDPDSGEDDYELIDWVTDSLSVLLTEHTMRQEPASEKKPISLFDPQTNPDAMKIESPSDQEEKGRYSHLPEIPTPKVLQAPHQIPPLFPFTRSTVYLLMSPQAQQKNIRSVVLRATSIHGPLEIEIPIETLSEPGETIHQLAAKKAVRDLEEDRGWLVDAKDKNEKSVKQHYPGRYDEIVEREAVRLGVGYQVGGKFCSFVAVSVDEKNNKDRMTEPDKAGDVNEENVLWISRMGDQESKSECEGNMGHGFYDTSPSSPSTLFGSRGGSTLLSMPSPSLRSGTRSNDTPLSSMGNVGITLFGALREPAHVMEYTSRPAPSAEQNRTVRQEITLPVALMTDNEKVHAIIGLQDFEEWWDFSERLIKMILGMGAGAFERVGGKEWVTLVVVVYLEKKMRAEEGIWELVVYKARRWLDGAGVDVSGMEAEAERVIGA